jgi:hypothetical protein
MGLAIDTIAFRALNPGAGPTAATAANGDTFTVRSFSSPAAARLLQVSRTGATKGFVQVRSPLFHDDVRGDRYYTSQAVAAYLAPQYSSQMVQSQDTLIVELSGGAAETDVGTLMIQYDNLGGAAARLHSWGDISGNIKSIKPLSVAATASATIGLWNDTGITTTEDLLHANTDYAVLGVATDTAVAALGIRGQETGNLRIAVGGLTDSFETGEQFVQLNERTGLPTIPVINAANKGSIFMSVMDVAASTAINGQLILAELATNLSN